jgi:small subunit ribosomal protein S16
LLRIRLSRVGKKKQPAYRMVVADSRSPRDGAFLKIIGHYNPLTDPVTLVVKEDEAVHWLEKGAIPSETAAKLLTRIGIMERAGKAPVRYEGKAVPPAPKKETKASAPAEPKPTPAKAKDEPDAEPEAQASAAAEPAPPDAAEESVVDEAPPEPQDEEAAPEPEVTTEEQPEAKEAGAEPEATNDEQPQE